jgi:hypothetical protein
MTPVVKLAALLGFAVAAGGVAAVAVRSGHRHLPAPARAAASVQGGSAAPMSLVAGAGGEAMARVARLAGRQDPGAVSELVDLYGKLAGSPDALDARKLAIKTLLAQPDMRVGLAAVLAAVAADQTPRSQDPMWPFLVREVASLWDTVTLEHGRDLVMIEERPKPRDVLLESLAEVPPGKLSDGQRAKLAADLIDLYPRLGADQRPAVDRALAALGSSDLVEILGRRGLAEDTYLKAAIEERRAQQAAQAARAAVSVTAAPR